MVENKLLIFVPELVDSQLSDFFYGLCNVFQVLKDIYRNTDGCMARIYESSNLDAVLLAEHAFKRRVS